MGIVVVSGTSAGAGTTVTTASIAVLARAQARSVAVVKPAQTGVLPGEPAGLAEIERLLPGADTYEYARYADALSPEAAARYAGDRPLRLTAVAKSVAALDTEYDLVLVVGSGGLLDRYGPDGWTLAELAWAVQAPVLLAATPGRDTPNQVSLTVEALKSRGLTLAGVVLTLWPATPGPAARTGVVDIEAITGQPLSGVLPEGAADDADFLAIARAALDASWGGAFDAALFGPETAGTSVTN